MDQQTDLFAAPVVPGLALRENVVTPAEEAALVSRMEAVRLEPFRFQGWTSKRLTATFGWRYDFEGGGFGRADPIPDFLLPLRRRAADLAGLAPDAFEQALLIRYDPGAGIGWHRDRPVFEHVVGVSLGAGAVMRFRRRTAQGFERRAVPLAPRAGYLLTGEVRHGWEHSIAPISETRWSVTFRTLSEKGGAAAAGAHAR